MLSVFEINGGGEMCREGGDLRSLEASARRGSVGAGARNVSVDASPMGTTLFISDKKTSFPGPARITFGKSRSTCSFSSFHLGRLRAPYAFFLLYGAIVRDQASFFVTELVRIKAFPPAHPSSAPRLVCVMQIDGNKGVPQLYGPGGWQGLRRWGHRRLGPRDRSRPRLRPCCGRRGGCYHVLGDRIRRCPGYS